MMTEQKHDDARGASSSDAGLGAFNPLIPAFEAMRKDAERYRWLRMRHAPQRHEVNFWTGQSWDVLEGEKLDASIDAARAPNA